MTMTFNPIKALKSAFSFKSIFMNLSLGLIFSQTSLLGAYSIHKTFSNVSVNPSSIAAGSFQRVSFDLTNDFAVTNSDAVGGNNLTIFFSNTDGTFTQSAQIDLSSYSLPTGSWVVAGLFNSPSQYVSDLAVLLANSRKLLLFPNDNTGYFRGPPTELTFTNPLSGYPVALAVGNLLVSGTPTLSIVVINGNGTIDIYAQNGPRTFSYYSLTTTYINVTSGFTGSFNPIDGPGDGIVVVYGGTNQIGIIHINDLARSSPIFVEQVIDLSPAGGTSPFTGTAGNFFSTDAFAKDIAIGNLGTNDLTLLKNITPNASTGAPVFTLITPTIPLNTPDSTLKNTLPFGIIAINNPQPRPAVRNDIAIACQSSSSIAYLTNNQDDTFTQATPITGLNGPIAMTQITNKTPPGQYQLPYIGITNFSNGSVQVLSP